jgi:hypothetical protein
MALFSILEMMVTPVVIFDNISLPGCYAGGEIRR